MSAGYFYNLLGGGNESEVTMYMLVNPQPKSGGGYSIGTLSGDFRFVASAPSKLVVDWGDGTTNTYDNLTDFSLQTLKTYTTSQQRQVKLTFSPALNFTLFNVARSRIQGNIPAEIGFLKSLTNLVIQSQDISSVPIQAFNLPLLQYLAIGDCPQITFLPDLFANLTQLQTLAVNESHRLSTFPASIGNCLQLEEINMVRAGLLTGFTWPSAFNQLTGLKRLYIGTAGAGGVTFGASLPLVVSQCPNLQILDVMRTSMSNLNNIQNLVNLTELRYGTDLFSGQYDGSFPAGFQNLTKLKTINARGAYNTQAKIDFAILSLYNIAVAQASITAGGNANIWRNVNWNLSGSNPVASGTLQAPAGYVQGSANGSPVSAKERAYVLINQYGWTITLN